MLTEQSTKHSPTAGSRLESSPQQRSCLSPDAFLLEENMVVVDTRLDEDAIASKSRNNKKLRKDIDTVQYRLQQKLYQKKFLQETLDSITRADTTATSTDMKGLDGLEHEIEEWEDKICCARIDHDTYANMLQYLRKDISTVRVSIQDTKDKLKKMEGISTSANGTGEAADTCVETKEEETKEKGVEPEQWKKLSAAKTEYDAIVKGINEIKVRMEKQETAHNYRRLREKRYEENIRRLKEKQLYFNRVLYKLNWYQSEFSQQFLKLTTVFQAEKKEEIMERKERRDIQLQSERFGYTDRISQLQAMKETYCELKKELEGVKSKPRRCNDETLAQRIYDMGEYNPDITSSTYVKLRMEFQRQQGSLEEKLGLLRKVISGIKHILFKLLENDPASETGRWYDLKVVAAMDDISTQDVRPGFSKLLLILEQKITCFCTLVLQKVRHMPVPVADILMSAEDPAAREDLEMEVIKEKTAWECCAVLRQFYESFSLCAKLEKTHSVQSVRRSRPDPDPSKKLVSGTDIPRLVLTAMKRRMSTTLDMMPNNPGQENVMEESESYDKSDLDSTQRMYSGIDMMHVHENMNELIYRKQKRSSVIGPQTVAESAEAKKQAEAANTFNKERYKEKIKCRLYKDMHKRPSCTMNYPSSLKPIADVRKPQQQPQHKNKKKLNQLTIQLEKAMHNRPPDVIDIATTTVDALEKFRRANDIRFVREIESNRILMPNFLNIILKMKKLKGTSDIRQIAAKCQYFTKNPIDVPSFIPYTPQAKAHHTYSSIDSIQSIQHRLQNIKSLNKLEGTGKYNATALDFYYKGVEPASDLTPAARRAQVLNSSVTSIVGAFRPPAHLKPLGRNAKAGSYFSTRREKQSVGSHMFTLKQLPPTRNNSEKEEIYRVLSSVSLGIASEGKKKRKNL